MMPTHKDLHPAYRKYDCKYNCVHILLSVNCIECRHVFEESTKY